MTPRTSQAGFTLIELMIAMVIFTVMSVMVMSVYLNTTFASRKLNATRQLTEVAREITERLAQDVREYGIADGWTPGIGFDPTVAMWDTYDYTGSGSEFLTIQGKGVYVYGRKTDIGIVPCKDTSIENIKTNSSIHCGLYLVPPGDNGVHGYNLVDSFIPEESSKRVKIEDLKFYVSGGDFTTNKVTLVMSLVLMPRIGVPYAVTQNTKIHIQTTISERGWKKH